jgi:CheY-like chemotaxis protein
VGDRPIRVVVVDNDPEVLSLLVTDLTLEGHEVVATASRGEEAIEVCRELRPDAVIIDFRMPPGINGVEAAARLRQELPDLRVVLYTNYVNPDVARGARRAGAVLIEKGNLRALRRALVD